MKKNTSIYPWIAQIKAMMSANNPDFSQIEDEIIGLRMTIFTNNAAMWKSADRRFVSRFNTIVRQFAAVSGWPTSRFLIKK